METDALVQLLSTSTSQLKGLYEQIGDPGKSYQNALQDLYNALTTNVQAHLAAAQTRVEEIKFDCNAKRQEAAMLQAALGEEVTSTEGIEQSKLSLHQQQQAATRKVKDLRTIYDSRKAEATKLLLLLEEQKHILEDFVQPPPVPAAPTPAGTTADASATQEQILALPLDYLAALRAEVGRGEKEILSRTTQLQGHLEEIFANWSELHLPPDVQNDEFDAHILTHLQVRPLWHQVDAGVDGETHSVFQGEFEPFENKSNDLDVFAPPVSTAPTPTRKSTGSDPSISPACLQVAQPAGATPLQARILPTSANLQRAIDKRQMLEQEKARREAKIQTLYDELSELWMKFDVPEDEMDAFVQSNCGSTLQVIEMYQRELQKMQELRKEHMALFIEKVRERIRRLWDTLRLTEEERMQSFPPCFEEASTATEEMLEQHEEAIARLSEEVQAKAPVLEVISRYQTICDEERQMEEDAKDPNRFKSTRGDPGRLLREEKTRKRIKVQKPKLQQELLRVIPEWESTHGKTFTIDGVPYFETIKDLVNQGSQKDPKKRSRTASSNSAISSQEAHTLANSHAHNRVAATPMRGPSTPAIGSTAKRQRVAPPSTVRAGQNASSMPPPSTITRTAGPASRQASKIGAPPSAVRGQARSATGTTLSASAKLKAQSNFRPRPSAMLQAYVGSGGGRRSAEGVSSSRTVSHSSQGTVIMHERISPSSALQDAFTSGHIRAVHGVPESTFMSSGGPNWCAVEEE